MPEKSLAVERDTKAIFSGHPVGSLKIPGDHQAAASFIGNAGKDRLSQLDLQPIGQLFPQDHLLAILDGREVTLEDILSYVVDFVYIGRICARQGYAFHVVLVGECHLCAKAGRDGNHTGNGPYPVHEAPVKVNVVISFPGCDCDVRKILNDYIKKHTLKSILHGDGYQRYGHSYCNSCHREESASLSVGDMPHDHRELKVGNDVGQGRHLCEPLCRVMGYQVSGLAARII